MPANTRYYHQETEKKFLICVFSCALKVTGCFQKLHNLLITGDRPGGTDVRRGCLLFGRWRD